MTPLLSVSLLSFLCTSAVFAWQWGSEFSQWMGQSATVVGNWLYVDGGEFWRSDGPDNAVFNFSMICSTQCPVPHVSYNYQVSLNEKPWQMWPRRRPMMWYDPFNDLVYSWGGYPYYGPDTEYYFWSFKPNVRGWTSWTMGHAPVLNGVNMTPTWYSSWTSSDEQFFSIGGIRPFENNKSVPIHSIPGIATYNFQGEIWRNRSSSGVSETGFSNRGQVLFLPHFGSRGVLIVLGGDDVAIENYDAADLVDMADVKIYDIATTKWTHQKSQGSIPARRAEFCAVGAEAPDNATYEIFVYGGSTGKTFDIQNAANPNFLDIFVLSLPSFQWFRTSTTNQIRRSYTTCKVIGNRQMVVIGGTNPSTGDDEWLSKDPFTNGIGIFDLTALEWTSRYDADAPAYQRPAVVQDYYASNPKYPNWSSSEVAALFTTNATLNLTSTNSSSHHNHSAAIAGGVVGGVILIFIIAFAVWYHSRRKKSTASSPAKPTGSISDPQGSSTDTHELSAKSLSPERHEIDGVGRHELEGKSGREAVPPRYELDGTNRPKS